MTLFLADLDRDACDVRKIDKLGRAAVDSNEVFIHNLEATPEQVVGDVGRGFDYLLDGLNPEQIVIGMEAAGIGRAALVWQPNTRVTGSCSANHRLQPSDSSSSCRCVGED